MTTETLPIPVKAGVSDPLARLAISILEQAQIDALFLDHWSKREWKSSTYYNRMEHLGDCADPLAFLRDQENAPRLYLESQRIPTGMVDNWVERYDAGERARPRKPRNGSV